MKLPLTIFLIVALLLTHYSYGQDSIAVKVIEKPRVIRDTVYYKLRVYNMGSKEVVWTKCCCKDRMKRKGDIVMIARKDLEIY